MGFLSRVITLFGLVLLTHAYVQPIPILSTYPPPHTSF